MRITHISDTHNKHNQITKDLLGGDIIIHSGDMSSIGRKNEILRFLNWFTNLPYTHKIFVAGNHDLSFDSEVLFRKKYDYFEGYIEYNTPVVDGKPEWLSNELTNLSNGTHYLENSDITIDGIKIWGSPYSAKFGREWAFNVNRGVDSKKLWDTIPSDANIVITHGPIFGILDKTSDNRIVGCEDLRQTIMKINPDFHLCGHIHESYGYSQFGDTHCINGSNVSLNYDYKNKPVTFDYDFETKEISFL